MDISDRLEVKIIEARELKTLNGLKPNAYVEVVCGLDTQSTKHVTESVTPNWSLPAMVFNHLLAAEVDTILIYLKHKNIFGSVDTPLGVAVIPLDTVYNSPKIEIDDWYNLTESADMNDEASGSVRVIMTYWNDSDLDMLQHDYNDQDMISSAPNLLEVTVLRASDIGGEKGNLIDSFVIVQVTYIL